MESDNINTYATRVARGALAAHAGVNAYSKCNNNKLLSLGETVRSVESLAMAEKKRKKMEDARTVEWEFTGEKKLAQGWESTSVSTQKVDKAARLHDDFISIFAVGVREDTK